MKHLLPLAILILLCSAGCMGGDNTADAPTIDKPIELAQDEPVNNGGYDPR